MTRGKPVSEDLRRAIVRMARTVNLDLLSTYTDISRRQILRILSLYRATGKVTTAKDRRRIGHRSSRQTTLQ
jgi:hypothetical protein